MAIKFSYDTGLIEVGRYRAAPIFLSPGFFLLAGVLAFPFWRTATLRGLLLTVLFVAIAFVSILLHELAHAEVARRCGVGSVRIDINMAGGLVHFRGLPHTMAQDRAITAAGPLANLTLALVALAVLAVLPGAETGTAMVDGFQPLSLGEPLLWATAYLNGALFVVNLLPGLPLDGGKLVYLLIEQRSGARTALGVVSGLGLFFACVMTFILIGTALAGYPVWSPPEFRANWQGFRAAWNGRGDWEDYTGWSAAPRPPETSRPPAKRPTLPAWLVVDQDRRQVVDLAARRAARRDQG